jgi:hypothetical protein
MLSWNLLFVALPEYLPPKNVEMVYPTSLLWQETLSCHYYPMKERLELQPWMHFDHC